MGKKRLWKKIYSYIILTPRESVSTCVYVTFICFPSLLTISTHAQECYLTST